MANNIAFQPMGKTVKVVATGAANTESTAFTITADSPVNQYYISNDNVNNFAYVRINATNLFNVALPDTVPGYAWLFRLMDLKYLLASKSDQLPMCMPK